MGTRSAIQVSSLNSEPVLGLLWACPELVLGQLCTAVLQHWEPEMLCEQPGPKPGQTISPEQEESLETSG